ncbi:MAG TPA: DUF2752 domain-containing protein [Holophagaceae bacterium]|nr:DUF2752 domain-containing protein [Holophagaceae bacterium]
MKARRIPWVALAGGVGLALAVVAAWLQGLGLLRFPACPLKTFTGLPCATCGLTRWALALGHQDWRAAFHWHPVATVLLLAWPLVAFWDVLRASRNRPYPELPQSAWARGAVLGLLLGTWVLQAVRGI